jgi:hypothetical protein
MNATSVFHFCLAMALLYGTWTETGVWTTLCLGAIMLRVFVIGLVLDPGRLPSDPTRV